MKYFVKPLSRIASIVSCRRFSSSTQEFSLKANSEYIKTILKKFMFQVHPDYFFNFKQYQDVNNQNLRLLQSLFYERNDLNSNYQSQGNQLRSDMRSLTFFVKPNDLWQEPKKVKVATNRLLDSMIEILETIGIEIPKKPQDFDYYESLSQQQRRSSSSHQGGNVWASYPYGPQQNEDGTVLDSETMRILQFLDSIDDRRELISLREDRINILQETEKELLHLTGLKKIEYWNSWSAHNNRLLLINILSFIKDHHDLLQLPWNGMSLILAKDDAAAFNIDYIEGYIRIDCSNISALWVSAFQQITKQHLKQMKEVHNQINQLTRDMEERLTHWVNDELSHYREISKPKFVIEIVRGFTCTQRRYAEWIGRIQKESQSVHSESRKSVKVNDPKQPQSDSNFKLPTIPQLPSSFDQASSSDRIDLPPLRIKCIIEDSHGTKLLSNGNLRFDCLSTAAQIQQLIHSQIGQSIQRTHQQQLIDTEISILERGLIAHLEISSVHRGSGIDEEKYLTALRNLTSYLAQKNALTDSLISTHQKKKLNRGILKHLHGLRVIIGYYHGIRDDGACLLPWNFRILEVV